MVVRRLTAGDGGQVAELAARAYPQAFALSPEELEETLEALTDQENLCFGVFADGRLTAYLMCWLDTSQVEGQEQEAVLLLDDIVVLGETRSQLIRLLRCLRSAIVERGWEQLAIEGIHRAQAEQLFNRHPGVVARLGYQLAAVHHYYGDREQEQLCWARYEPNP